MKSIEERRWGRGGEGDREREEGRGERGEEIVDGKEAWKD
jgi:hypothetical protein